MNNYFDLEIHSCKCLGKGWVSIDDDWIECPVHFAGQIHPDSYNLLVDDPKKLAEEQKRQELLFKIKSSNNRIEHLFKEIKAEKAYLNKLEYELVNKTPTIEMKIIPNINYEE